jgi:hypothetical protein
MWLTAIVDQRSGFFAMLLALILVLVILLIQFVARKIHWFFVWLIFLLFVVAITIGARFGGKANELGATLTGVLLSLGGLGY